MSQETIESLAERVAALESLAKCLLATTAIRMAIGGVDGGPMIAARFCAGNSDNEKRPGGSVNKIHPADQVIKDGAKLRTLAQELDRR